jgi:FKBP-type peptidyl-prolyl cis-trans isomerase FklB
MKKITFILTLAAAVGFTSCNQAPKADLKTSIDTLSYSIGMAGTQGFQQWLLQQQVDSTVMADFMKGFYEGATSEVTNAEKAYMMGKNVGENIANNWVKEFNRQAFGADTTHTLSANNILAGFIAGVKNDTTYMKVTEARAYQEKNIKLIRERTLRETYADWIARCEQFLADNKTKEGVVTTPSGLQYKIIKAGKGAIPEKTDMVSVNYRGTLVDSTEFDSSYKRNEPTKFRVDQVVKGWTEALSMMPVGSKWELYIPQELAYGEREIEGKPFSTLIFEVELVGIEPKATPKKK